MTTATEVRYILGYAKAASRKSGLMEFVLSEESPDRMDDIIRQDGWDLANFKSNPVMLWAHDSRVIPPIGKWRNIQRVGKQLTAVGVFDETDPFAVEIERKLRAGILNGVSVGFRVLKKRPRGDGVEGWEFLKSELLEASIVSIPAHPNALAKRSGAPVIRVPRELVEMERRREERELKQAAEALNRDLRRSMRELPAG